MTASVKPLDRMGRLDDGMSVSWLFSFLFLAISFGFGTGFTDKFASEFDGPVAVDDEVAAAATENITVLADDVDGRISESSTLCAESTLIRLILG